jgi:hypothetical protein
VRNKKFQEIYGLPVGGVKIILTAGLLLSKEECHTLMKNPKT